MAFWVHLLSRGTFSWVIQVEAWPLLLPCLWPNTVPLDARPHPVHPLTAGTGCLGCSCSEPSLKLTNVVTGRECGGSAGRVGTPLTPHLTWSRDLEGPLGRSHSQLKPEPVLAGRGFGVRGLLECSWWRLARRCLYLGPRRGACSGRWGESQGPGLGGPAVVRVRPLRKGGEAGGWLKQV